MFNVMVGIADEKGVPQLSDVCRRMARGLRYSSSDAGERVTLGDELSHVSDYLLMMKLRFEDGLDYEISVPEGMRDLPAPRLVLQPLVENALSHGFNNHTGVRFIRIAGELSGQFWQLYIEDNGSGFELALLQEIRGNLDQYIQAMERGSRQPWIGIGGMGLVNTMARLWYFFGKEFAFEINNRPEGGACIVLRSGPKTEGSR